MAHTTSLAHERHSLQLGNRGRIVVPAEVRNRLDLKRGDRHFEMMNRGLLGGMLEVTPLLPEECATIARLRPMCKDLGLSLGDRACLALGVRLGLPV